MYIFLMELMITPTPLKTFISITLAKPLSLSLNNHSFTKKIVSLFHFISSFLFVLFFFSLGARDRGEVSLERLDPALAPRRHRELLNGARGPGALVGLHAERVAGLVRHVVVSARFACHTVHRGAGQLLVPGTAKGAVVGRARRPRVAQQAHGHVESAFGGRAFGRVQLRRLVLHMANVGRIARRAHVTHRVKHLLNRART